MGRRWEERFYFGRVRWGENMTITLGEEAIFVGKMPILFVYFYDKQAT